MLLTSSVNMMHNWIRMYCRSSRKLIIIQIQAATRNQNPVLKRIVKDWQICCRHLSSPLNTHCLAWRRRKNSCDRIGLNQDLSLKMSTKNRQTKRRAAAQEVALKVKKLAVSRQVAAHQAKLVKVQILRKTWAKSGHIRVSNSKTWSKCSTVKTVCL